MRILLVTILFSGLAFGNDDKSMQDLFQKYDQVMDYKKVELIDEVFTKKFIQDSGGKEELISKIKELPTPTEKSKSVFKPVWRKALRGDTFFAKVKEEVKNKKKTEAHETEFVIQKEDGKLKIDGNLGDAN